MIFQGQAGEAWRHMKLRELLKLPGYGRTAPLLAKAVYIGAPESTGKEAFRTHEALIIKNYGTLTPALLEPFLARLREAR